MLIEQKRMICYAYAVMLENLKKAFDGNLEEISNAYDAENRINQLRDNLRNEEIEDFDHNTKNYQTSVYFIDTVNEFEKMGDFMINISQDLIKAYHRVD